MKIELENGRVTFNLVDMLTELEPEEKEEIVSHFAWQDPIWHEIKRMVAEEFAAKGYNSRIHELRIEFLRSDYVKDNIARAVESLLEQIAQLEDDCRDYRKNLWKWESWYRDSYRYEPFPIEYQRTPPLCFLNTSTALKFLESEGVLAEDVEYPEKE